MRRKHYTKLGLTVFKAGIEDGNLILILEPEAASCFCRVQQICRVVKVDNSVQLEKMPVGHKYIVADLGGGTADIAVHEVIDDNNLREISRSDGDANGGIQVDRAFWKFLEDIYGPNVISTLRKDKASTRDIRASFEQKKRNFQLDESEIRIQLRGIKKAIKRTENADTDNVNNDALKRRFNGKVEFKVEKLVIHSEIMQQLFEPTINGIIKFIQKLRNDENVDIINTAILVGGLSNSKYIQNMIQNTIPGLRVIVPPDPTFAVLKGAVLFCKNPSQITERIARFSYGFSFARIFKKDIDPVGLRFKQNGITYCNKVFDKLITKGEILVKGTERLSAYTRIEDMENGKKANMLRRVPVLSEIYKSEKTDPKYTTAEDGSEFIGRIVVMPPNSGWPLVAVIKHGLVVEGSELLAFARDHETEALYEARFDCL
ncbi:heat shock 70 kDa protein 12B-like isoform X2 [Dreissena polymorpha]|uniref:heat shock 70 kDa protein 12B-like isoform X2 n=1 Tax=Dreissena polymorpha TaxID=45954 RepID=UPI002263C3C4|nr:heat shock 70 kDa protein 12B-like isoform X2 [Dreissena polymorpha]